MAEHLTALDATFLELEQADQSAHMHIGAVLLFEPPTRSGAPSLELLRAELERRMHRLPRFGQRLSGPRTGGLRWPTWQEDERFDISHHVVSAGLPAPAGEAELLEWAGDFFAQRLDRTRPLWEIARLELADGRWAMATKTHHCMVDGVGSLDIAHTLLDAEPEPANSDDRPAEASLSPFEEDEDAALPRRLARPVMRVAAATARLGERGVGAALHPRRARQAFDRSRAMVELILRDEVVAAPKSSLNHPIGAKRRLAVVRAPLEDLRAIKCALGGTINDLVLAAGAGGLRDLLRSRGEAPPRRGLRAMVPVNARTAGERLALGNRISSLFVHLPVGEPDPLRRYRRQVEEAESLKAGTQALGSTAIVDLTSHAPPALHSFLARSLYATRLFNLTVTNVPGPQHPLYALGSRLEEIWPLVPLAAEHSLGLAVFSYRGVLFFCLKADRDSVEDLDVVSAGIERSIAELLALATERDGDRSPRRVSVQGAAGAPRG